MAINSVLFNNTSYVREPALLGIERGRSYESLADYLAADGTSTANTQLTDQVDLSLGKISGKMLTELAAAAAEVIRDFPEFQDDYVLAVIEEGSSRQARVYSRAEILASFEGTEAERAELAKSLAQNPLLFYSSAKDLPESSDSEAAGLLSQKANSFLATNQKLLDTLSKYGYSPFQTSEA
ncbi:MAG: hypothetical protein LBP22_06365 [Deltaproteobacteria bacterium]|jgi:hypothetical protein|nr:hypothetical protein [Deltaproteobacteria bacterium]